MNRSGLGNTSRKFLSEAAKFLLVSMLPFLLFYHRSLDYFRHYEFYLIYILYIVVLLSILVFMVKSAQKARKTKNSLFWFSFSCFILVLCSLFWKEISVLKEIIIFQTHQEDFLELVEIAENAPPEKSILDTYIEIPTRHKKWTEQSLISVFQSPENSPRLVAIYSRPDTYFTYLPNQRHLPKDTLYFQYGYGANCFYELAEYWFICSF